MWHLTRLKDNIDILIQIPASKYFYLIFYHIKRFHIFFTVLKEFIYAKIILKKNPVQNKVWFESILIIFSLLYPAHHARDCLLSYIILQKMMLSVQILAALTRVISCHVTHVNLNREY